MWKNSSTIVFSAMILFAVKKSMIDFPIPICAKTSLLGLFMSFLKKNHRNSELFFVKFKYFIQLTPYLLLSCPKNWEKSSSYLRKAIITCSTCCIVGGDPDGKLDAGLESLFTGQKLV